MIFEETKKEIRHARTVKVMPDAQKWDSALIESIGVTPYDEHEGHDPEVVFRDRPGGDEDAPRQPTKNRGIYIKGADIKAYGLTAGCQRCDHEMRYGPGRTTKGHSDHCRKRIVAELMKTPEGRRRCEEADERVDGPIADRPHGHGGQV